MEKPKPDTLHIAVETLAHVTRQQSATIERLTMPKTSPLDYAWPQLVTMAAPMVERFFASKIPQPLDQLGAHERATRIEFDALHAALDSRYELEHAELVQKFAPKFAAARSADRAEHPSSAPTPSVVADGVAN